MMTHPDLPGIIKPGYLYTAREVRYRLGIGDNRKAGDICVTCTIMPRFAAA